MKSLLAETSPALTLGHLPLDGIKAEVMMLEVQALVTRDFDTQLRHVGEQIKLLGKVKQRYRENINKVQEFMSQKVNTSRKDGQNFYEASFGQMADLFGSFVKIDYDLEGLKMTGETGFSLQDNGEKHTLDESINGLTYLDNSDGQVDVEGLVRYFHDGAEISDPQQAYSFASHVNGDEGALPFYLAKKNYSFEGGAPKFAVYEEPLNKMLEQVRNMMSGVEEQSELLGVQMNQLVAQRRNALDGLRELIRKTEEMRQNTLSRFGVE